MCLPTEVDGSAPPAAHLNGGRQGRKKSVSFKIAATPSSSLLLLSSSTKSRNSKHATAATTTVKVTSRSLVAILLGCAMVSFGAGHVWSDRALELYSDLWIVLGSVLLARRQQQTTAGGWFFPLPPPQQQQHRASNIYVFDHFDDAHKVRSYSVWTDSDGTTQNSTRCSTTSEPKMTVSSSNHGDKVSNENQNKGAPTKPEPAGHHLLVDLEHVDTTFLNSEERLAQAMIQLIRDSQDSIISTTNNHPPLQLLSYHCHGLEPTGVSCVGVLSPGSAMTFHTWPDEGVITLDLFVTMPHVSLVPLLDSFQSLFGVPREGTTTSSTSKNDQQQQPPPPRLLWAHKRRRGFRNAYPTDEATAATFNIEDVDLHSMLGGHNSRKHAVASVRTPFQHIEIFDVETTRFGGDGNDDDDDTTATTGRSNNQQQQPTQKRMDRMVYLDSVLQSRRFGEAAYHETLVHPALFAHSNPRRVVIIGGGEGATLREVLKHKTVTEVIMVEIDEIMVNVSRQYLPEWSDCSDLHLDDDAAVAVDSCFDDPRAKVYFEDAIQWFVDRYGSGRETKNDELVDVIIMDAL